MEIEKLKEQLTESGWNCKIEGGNVEISNPHFRTTKKYPVSTVEDNTLQNILLPHFLEACYRLDWEAAEDWMKG